jgi:hypothetical protein
MPSRDKPAEFARWCQQHITGNETFRLGSAAHIFLDGLFQSFGQPGCLNVRNENLQKQYCPG